MKYYCLVLVCLILSLSSYADNVKKMLERIHYAQLPFACTKGLHYPEAIWGYPYATDTHFSIEMYADLGLTVKEAPDPNTDCVMLRKFKVHDERFTLVDVGMDISESGKKVLVVYRAGELVDYIESEISWWSTQEQGVIYVKQWRITSNEEIIVTWLKVLSETPINAFSNFKEVNAQRIDMHYRIDANGKFQLTKEVKYTPRNYTRTYLADKTKNLWEGNETPIVE